jgi:DNA mismatch repair ATPase MutS
VTTRGLPASRLIAQLRRLVNLLDARRNQLSAFLGALVLFATQITLTIDAWRARHGASIEHWLTAVAELEALASLATHAAEHPDDCIPEIVSGPPRLEVSQAGHPLLAESDCVRNDVRLDADQRVLLVSGSNMSGKSTLLRTLGLNAVLALAGGTARARQMTLTPLFVGASIRVVDSLQEGSSRFYAEITRLHRIVEATREDLAVLFLLDEILHGTNSHDRQIGAEAVLKSLVTRGAIGLVTTHDLAITRPGQELAPYVTNVHFQDHLEDGHMHFDYQLHSGVVTKSNAIELMRSVGLDV